MKKRDSKSNEGKKVGITKVFTENFDSVTVPVVEVIHPVSKKEKSETPWYVKHMNGRWS